MFKADGYKFLQWFVKIPITNIQHTCELNLKLQVCNQMYQEHCFSGFSVDIIDNARFKSYLSVFVGLFVFLLFNGTGQYYFHSKLTYTFQLFIETAYFCAVARQETKTNVYFQFGNVVCVYVRAFFHFECKEFIWAKHLFPMAQGRWMRELRMVFFCSRREPNIN